MKKLHKQQLISVIIVALFLIFLGNPFIRQMDIFENKEKNRVEEMLNQENFYGFGAERKAKEEKINQEIKKLHEIIRRDDSIARRADSLDALKKISKQ